MARLAIYAALVAICDAGSAPIWYNPQTVSYGKTTKVEMQLGKLVHDDEISSGTIEIELHHHWAPLGILHSARAEKFCECFLHARLVYFFI